MTHNFNITHNGKDYEVAVKTHEYQDYACDADNKLAYCKNSWEITRLHIFDADHDVTQQMWPILDQEINRRIDEEEAERGW